MRPTLGTNIIKHAKFSLYCKRSQIKQSKNQKYNQNWYDS